MAKRIVSFDDKRLKKLERDLDLFAAKAAPFASMATLNNAAFGASRMAKNKISRDLVQRNDYTKRSIQVEPSRKQYKIHEQVARYGSVADYFMSIEFGGDKSGRGGSAVDLASNYSAGQAGKGMRKALPKRPNQMRNITLGRKSNRGSTKAQRNVLRTQQAIKDRKPYYMETSKGTKGIFRAFGGKGIRTRVMMLHNLSHESVKIPANPIIQPTTEKAKKNMPAYYYRALKQQLSRRGLFKG